MADGPVKGSSSGTSQGPYSSSGGGPAGGGRAPGPATPNPRFPRGALPGQRPAAAGEPGRRAGVRLPLGGRLRSSRARITGRAGVLALALCAVLLTVAYPFQQYLAQRSQIAALNAQNDATARQVATLQSEVTQWQNPEYVETQARGRLHYLMPGEIGFIVPGPADTQPLGLPSPSVSPWYDKLWSTVKSPSPLPSRSPSPSRSAGPSPKHSR
jgi:cell division protein FtsB